MARKKNSDLDNCAFRQAYGEILRYIVEGRHLDGTMLPSNVELAKIIFEGKVKPVRTAIKLLIEEGVIEARRGQGTKVKNFKLGSRLLTDMEQIVSDSSSISPLYDIPYLVTPRHDITFFIIEYHLPIRNIWEDLIEQFNRQRNGFQVRLAPYGKEASNHLNQGSLPQADVFQCQSVHIAPLVQKNSVMNLSGYIGGTSHYHRCLMDFGCSDEAIWGIPVTAVVFLHLASVGQFEKHKRPLPSWESFDEYIKDIIEIATMIKSRDECAIESDVNSFLYYLSLSGRLRTGRRIMDLDFNSESMRSFMKQLEPLYRNTKCSRHGHHDVAHFLNNGSFLWEPYSYGLDISELEKNNRIALLPPPINPHGSGHVVAHNICVSSNTKALKQSLAFINYLNSEHVAAFLVSRGLITGRCDFPGVPRIIQRTFEQSRVVHWNAPDEIAFLDKMTANILSWQSGHLTLEQACANIQFHQSRNK